MDVNTSVSLTGIANSNFGVLSKPASNFNSSRRGSPVDFATGRGCVRIMLTLDGADTDIVQPMGIRHGGCGGEVPVVS